MREPRRFADGDAVARTRGRHVTASPDDDGILEVLVQVIDVFDHPSFHRSGHGDVVEHRQMLHVLAQADAAGVRAHRHAELGGQQDDSQIFVHAAEAAAVNLAEIDRARLQQLLEDDAIRAVLAGGDADAQLAHRLRNPRMPQHIVRARRLLDPPWLERRELAHARDRFIDIPLLVGVDHQRAIGADRLADEPDPPAVVVGTAADLHLEVREPFGDRLAARGTNLLVGVAHPADRRRVRGIP